MRGLWPPPALYSARSIWYWRRLSRHFRHCFAALPARCRHYARLGAIDSPHLRPRVPVGTLPRRAWPGRVPRATPRASAQRRERAGGRPGTPSMRSATRYQIPPGPPSSSGIPRAAHTQGAAFHGLAARSTDLPCAHGSSAIGSLQGQPSGSSECLDGWRCRDVSLLRCRGDRRVRRPVADPRGRPRLGPRRSHQLDLPASIEAALSTPAAHLP